MRRRLATLLTAALLGGALLLPLTALPALGASGSGAAVVLATEGVTSTEGPDPMDPDATENEFAPPQYEANWTWRAGIYLLGLIILVVGYVALSYYLRVARPRSKNQQS